MTIPKGKERRQITLTTKAWKELEKQQLAQKKKYQFWSVGNITVSTVIEEMVFENSR